MFRVGICCLNSLFEWPTSGSSVPEREYYRSAFIKVPKLVQREKEVVQRDVRVWCTVYKSAGVLWQRGREVETE